MIPANKTIDRYKLTAQEIADKLGYNVQYVRWLAKTKQLPAIKRIREWRFDEAEVYDFLKKQTDSKGLNAEETPSLGDLLR